MNPIFEAQREILDRYAVGPELVKTSVQSLSEEQLDFKLTEDGWTIRQLVHHIADGDYLWKEFLLRAAGNPASEFSLDWYWCLPQDDWVKRWSYAEREVSYSLALLHTNRLHTLELLKKVPWLWEKSLNVPTSQDGKETVTVGEVVEMQCRHVEGHVEDIHQIRQLHGL